MSSAGDSGQERTRIGTIEAPYGREIRFDEVRFESGMQMLRLTIREGRRFTILDVDADTAAKWAGLMGAWANGAQASGAQER